MKRVIDLVSSPSDGVTAAPAILVERARAELEWMYNLRAGNNIFRKLSSEDWILSKVKEVRGEIVTLSDYIEEKMIGLKSLDGISSLAREPTLGEKVCKLKNT